MLTLKELSDYMYWEDKNPVEVRASVIKAGGWIKVFPPEIKLKRSGVLGAIEHEISEFPEWASRVRNYFNVTPAYFRLLPRQEGIIEILQTRDLRGGIGAHNFALSGDVYKDESQTAWFQMDTAATIYHYPGTAGFLKGLDAFFTKQMLIPVFKLISPDGTGGSLEVCVHNPRVHKVYVPNFGDVYVGEPTIGKVGVPTHVAHRIVTHEIYRGSYNYAETIIRGLDEHEYMDVKSHRGREGFYVNPKDIFSPVGSRVFPRMWL